jgi:hypothetical protein
LNYLIFIFSSANPKRIKEQELLKQVLDENKYDRRIRAYGEVDNGKIVT